MKTAPNPSTANAWSTATPRCSVRDSRQETEWAGNEDEVEFGLSNYLGYPVHAPDGTPYGTVCVLDSRPRDYSAEERALLENCGARSRRCWRNRLMT